MVVGRSSAVTYFAWGAKREVAALSHLPRIAFKFQNGSHEIISGPRNPNVMVGDFFHVHKL